MKRALISVLVLAAVALASIGMAEAQGDTPDPAVVPESVVITTGPGGNLALGITTGSSWSDGPPSLDSWWMDFYFVSASGAMYDFGVQGEAPSHGQPVVTEAYGTTDSGESMPQKVFADTSGTIWFLTNVPVADVGEGPFSGSINFASWENLNTTQRQSDFWNFESLALTPATPGLLPGDLGDLTAGFDILAGEPIAPEVTVTTVPAPPPAPEAATTLAPTTLTPTTLTPTTLAPTTLTPTTLAAGGAGGGAGAAGAGGGGGAALWIIIIGVILLVLSGFMIARGRKSHLTGNTRIDLPSSHFAKELGDVFMDLPPDEQRRVITDFKKSSNKEAYVGYVKDLYDYHAGHANRPPDPPVEPVPD